MGRFNGFLVVGVEGRVEDVWPGQLVIVAFAVLWQPAEPGYLTLAEQVKEAFELLSSAESGVTNILRLLAIW